MKAWGNKKIFRGEEVPGLEPWHVDHFSGASVQRPHLWREAPVIPSPEAESAEADAEQAADAVSDLPAEPEVPAGPTPEEIEAIREAARQAGYQAGFEQGRQAGYGAGEQTGREAGMNAGHSAGLQQGRALADGEVARFKAIVGELEKTVGAYEANLVTPITELALAVARQVLRANLTSDPTRIQAVIREALNMLPELQGRLYIELNPDDLPVVETLFAAEAAAGHWRFEADPGVARGGCRIGNAVMEVDLTLPERWRRVVEVLGSTEAWEDRG